MSVESENAAALFSKVRDVPFFLGPQGSSETLFQDNRGCCSRKHFFLLPRLKEIGYKVGIGIAVFDWRDLPIPAEILSLLRNPVQYHMFLITNGEKGEFFVDATWDKEMHMKHGFRLIELDEQNTVLGVDPLRSFRISSLELRLRSKVSDILNARKAGHNQVPTPFNDAFNSWLGRT